MTPAERYPLAPLEAWVASRSSTVLHRNQHTHDSMTPTALIAEALGLTEWAVTKMRARGLSERQADHAAIALGTHPALIWPRWNRDVPEHSDTGA